MKLTGNRWQEFGSTFLCYFTLLQSRKLYAHEVAPIDIMALILLCGDIDLKVRRDQSM